VSLYHPCNHGNISSDVCNTLQTEEVAIRLVNGTHYDTVEEKMLLEYLRRFPDAQTHGKTVSVSFALLFYDLIVLIMKYKFPKVKAT